MYGHLINTMSVSACKQLDETTAAEYRRSKNTGNSGALADGDAAVVATAVADKTGARPKFSIHARTFLGRDVV